MIAMIKQIVLIGGIWIALCTGHLNAQEILNGAGATFPAPFYGKLIEEYQRQSATRIDYRSIGSGGGIKMLLEKKTDFGGSDIFLSDADLEAAPAPILHIPTCIGAVAIITNLPDKPSLRLDSTLLADLLMGRITTWSDPALRCATDSRLPAGLNVTVVHRSDSSGTTHILTDYLSRTSKRWEKQIGCGKRVAWQAGMGVPGNGGVSDMVSRIPGSIGYVSLSYAEKRSLKVAAIKNRSGRHIQPTQDSVSLAANVSLPRDCRVLITDTTSPDGYPISAFTYILVYREQGYAYRTREKADALIHFLTWVVTDGQQYAKPLYYSPLPDEAVKCSMGTIRSITFTDSRPAD
jgi:phosphate transport system substrate-binding protein